MPRPAELRLGTRGSQLALWQAHAVAARLQQAGAPPCRIVIIKTSGDQLQSAKLSEVGGKRLFVKEIEDALVKGEIDLAVHSSKDLPAELPPGLGVTAVLPREDPHDAVVLGPSSRVVASISDVAAALGRSPSMGTGSVRRIAQLTRLFPGARFTAIRGNLDTRLRKLDAGEYDALVLAAAGLRRLGFAARISLTLPADACVPAPGQGIVAIETRVDDRDIRAAIEPIDDERAHAELRAERAVVAALGGGCQTPIGALAVTVDGVLDVAGVVIAVDGSRAVRAHARGPAASAETVGARVGRELLAKGAGEILAEMNGTSAADGGRPAPAEQY